MCGICGIYGDAYDKKATEKMVASMHHRGPDDNGIYTDEKMSMGMARLAIIDLSSSGHQPMSNMNRTIWIVYNGETYNFKIKRKELEEKGYLFKSTSDTEVVLNLYQEYGDDFLEHMQGIFALAIYDKRRGYGKERLLLARDHMGIKPLLYSRSQNNFLFASEIKALIASGIIDAQCSPESLRLLMSYGSIPQPSTILENVYMLKAGHRLIIENGRESLDCFWKLNTGRIPYVKEATYKEQVDIIGKALTESIRMQMVSDVPVGAFLSGGVDSSLTAAIMAKICGSRVMTFSVGFGEEGKLIDESHDAEKIAEFIGSDHSRVVISEKDVFDKLSHIARALDQPSVDGVNSYFVSYAASRSTKVAISGTGGDELFAGYPWFLNMLKIQEKEKNKSFLSNYLKILSDSCKNELFDKIDNQRLASYIESARKRYGFIAQYSRQYQIFGVNGTRKILSKDMKAQSHIGREASHDLYFNDELHGGTTIERVTGLCLRGYTQNQLLRDIDAVSMAHSLEVRVPFLDHKFVDHALSLPDETKVGKLKGQSNVYNSTYRDTGQKRILIDIGKGILPNDMDLQVKRGFGLPFNEWLNGTLKEVMSDTLSERSIRNRGIFDFGEVDRIHNAFMNGNISWPFPWLLIITELWCREVLDGRT